jgi:hypothetical protein
MKGAVRREVGMSGGLAEEGMDRERVPEWVRDNLVRKWEELSLGEEGN